MFAFLRRTSPLWRHANFNRLWAAQILSAFGSRITRTAIPIIAVGVLSVSAWEAAVLSALTYLPYVLAGLFGGGFVERANKTGLMVTMDLVRFVVVIATPIAWYFNALSASRFCVCLLRRRGPPARCSRTLTRRSSPVLSARIMWSRRTRACRPPNRLRN